MLRRLAEGIRPCKLDQINADPKSERTSISELYLSQSVQVPLVQVRSLEEVLDKGALCHQFYLTHTASTLRRMLLKGLETLK